MGVVIDARARFDERRKAAEASRTPPKPPSSPSDVRTANLRKLLDKNDQR